MMGDYFSFFDTFLNLIFKEETYYFAIRGKDFKLKYLHMLLHFYSSEHRNAFCASYIGTDVPFVDVYVRSELVFVLEDSWFPGSP